MTVEGMRFDVITLFPQQFRALTDEGVVARALSRGLASLIDDEADLSVVAEAGSGEEALKMLGEMEPDVAILDLRLNRLTGLERQKIEDEYASVLSEIERLNEILADRGIRMGIIKSELLEMKEKYGDERRSEIDYVGGGDIYIEDLIEDEQVVVSLSHQGLIKRTPSSDYEAQGRGGVGRRGSAMRDEDFIEHLFVGNAHDWLLFFTDQGKCYWLRVYEIPEGRRTSKGRSIRKSASCCSSRATAQHPQPR